MNKKICVNMYVRKDGMRSFFHENGTVIPVTILSAVNLKNNLENIKLLNVYGKTKGHGFAGGIKRWNFSGGPASHGVSKAHRKIGSIGSRKPAGRIWKGKKMPGHYGGVNTFIRNVKIIHFSDDNTCLVKGSIPGPRKSYIKIKEAK